MRKIQNIHDKFLKQSFSDLRVAREFFENYLPDDIKKHMDLSSLKLENESFIDEKLSLTMSDMLFSTKIDGKIGYIYTLMEHWSTPDKKMPFRTMRYVLDAMDKHLTAHNTTTLPIVYPIILYQNKKPYPGFKHVFEMFEPEQQDLARAIFKNPFQIVDLATLEDEELIKHELLGIVLLYMKHICKKDVISLVNFFDYFHKISEKYGYDLAKQACILETGHKKAC